VEHKKYFTNGDIHTNNMESFWASLKRGIMGQYHKVSMKHLNEYIGEFCYRHNNRKNGDMFEVTIKRALGVI
jgi:transposase-like protein